MIECNNPLDALNAAKDALPMPRLFQRYGMGEFTEKESQKRATCPWCQKAGKLTIKRMEDKYWVFKCWSNSCVANARTEGKDELGFICLKEGMPRKGSPAFALYLEWAGVTIVSDSDRKKAKKKRAADVTKTDPASTTPPSASSGPGDSESAGGGIPPEPPDPIDAAPAATFGGSRSVWESLHAKLTLSQADRDKLKKDRGFSDETIDKLGFRSNTRRNEVALNSLTTEFPMRDLIRAGLFKRGRGQQPEVETQFMGWGIQSTKKDEKGKDQNKWGWTERPLIPYLDEMGRPWFIRPHKGNIGKDDKDDDEVCGGHVYCPYLLATRVEDNAGLCVLTESEFKAAALWQCGIPAIGIPGTAFVRNHMFRRELVQLLERYRITDLVIAFDNEVKDRADLPGYKANPRDRHWTAVWARYIAWDLMKKSPRPPMLESVRIAHLPDEWRVDADGKETGKIDWDTALANFVRQADGNVRQGTNVARAAFTKVIESACTPNEYVDLFQDDAQRIITIQLNHLFREPLLKSGSDKEEKLARRFDRVSSTKEMDELLGDERLLAHLARDMSRALRSVNGTYYSRRKPSEKRGAKLLSILEEIKERIAAIGRDASKDEELTRLKLQKRLINEAMEGTPEPISNFTLKCEYCLHTAVGKTERLMRFVNNQGERTKLLRVPGLAFSRLADWRTFCNERTQGVAVWRGAEKELQALVEDMKNYSAFSDIYQVPHYGLYHDLWFNGDCAYADGQTILADENNVFWHAGVGYQIDSSKEERGSRFAQQAPLLLAESHPRVKEDEFSLKELFHNFCTNLYEVVGDCDAFLAVGMVLGYAASPEVYREKGAHPGLWLYGKRSSGKTTIARWLMKIWGFPELPGTRIDVGTSHIGMQRDLNQYAFLPFWFDEYRRDVDARKETVIRGAFDRSSTSKGIADGGTTNETINVKTLTTPLITGESSSNDGATRSRYAHVLIAANRRNKDKEPERLAEMHKQSRHLYRIGRFLMENRKAFTELMLQILDEWLANSEIRAKILDERTRVVHGYGYAAFNALSRMLTVGVCPEEYFKTFLVAHSAQALYDVQEETMINKFWTALISGIQRGAVSKGFFHVRTVQIKADGTLIHDKHKFELNTDLPVHNAIYIAAQPAFDEYAQDIRRQGSDAPLSKTDIEREISKEPYFIQRPDGGGASGQRSHRATLGTFRGACWVLNLASMPYAQELLDALSDEADRD